MKKLILIGAAIGLFACSSPAPETGYTVDVTLIGEAGDIKSDTLVLANRSKEETIETIAVVKDGKCTFKGELTTPETYTISFKGTGGALARLFLENDKYSVTIQAAKPEESKVEGGNTQSLLNKISAKRDELAKEYKLDSLVKAYEQATDEQKKVIETTYENAMAEVEKIGKDYLAANPTSVYALNDLSTNVSNMPIDSVDAKLARFKALPEYASNRNIAEIEKVITAIKALQPGMQAPDFTQNDPDGNPVKFSDIYSKNKVTMVDFWASWCGPCRAFNPTLVKIYNDYKKKGFGIIGVSLDTKHDAWVKGIKDDKLTWDHVSDLGGWKNVVGTLYCVQYVPQNIFVDQTGKIIKRHVSEEEIITLLNENLK